jgi:hypothetical protein
MSILNHGYHEPKVLSRNIGLLLGDEFGYEVEFINQVDIEEAIQVVEDEKKI